MISRTEMIRSHNLDLLTSDHQRVMTYHVHQNGGGGGKHILKTYPLLASADLFMAVIKFWDGTRGQPICQYDSTATARISRVTERDHNETALACRRLFMVCSKTARKKMMWHVQNGLKLMCGKCYLYKIKVDKEKDLMIKNVECLCFLKSM